MMPQIVVQRWTARFREQIPEHQILAAALGKARAVFLAQGCNPCVAMLALYLPALVAVTPVKASFGLCHHSLLKN
jgi:hypothetical protein